MNVHRRKRLIFLTLIILASVFLAISFLTEFLLAKQTIYSEHNYSERSVIPPNSNTSIDFEVTANFSNLRIELTANNTLIVSVLQSEKLRWNWEASELKRNIIGDLEPGDWTVNFQNNNETSCSYSYYVTLEEPHEKWIKSYTWLRIPFFISAIIVFSLIPTIYYFDKIKPNLNVKSLKIITTAIILVSLLFSYQIAGFILNTSRPFVYTTGISMLPTMQPGDLVFIKGVDPKTLEVGDTIIFKQIVITNTSSSTEWKTAVLSTAVMHRIIELLEKGDYTYFQTQGDNLPQKDEYLVPEYGVLGKAILIVPKMGIIVFILSNIEVKLFLISLIIFILFFWPIIKAREKQKEQENKEAKKSNGENPK